MLRDALHIGALWMHILGIALFLGPQFFLAFAWVPASRGIDDMRQRVKAMRTITNRFGWIGGIGLLLILIAGTYLIATWRDYYAQPDVGFMSIRYGQYFTTKMIVLAFMLILLATHMFWVGPKLLDRIEAEANGENVTEQELRILRVRSMGLSISVLVLTLIIMIFGAMLTTYRFSMGA